MGQGGREGWREETDVLEVYSREYPSIVEELRRMEGGRATLSEAGGDAHSMDCLFEKPRRAKDLKNLNWTN
ncbi:hypothetical protein Naga_101567g1 [Nannochloropsis gaditana]|uniref:Uncharacterized protein n=1 Tax=Nannochloropsis gaditana TaxID=72520 RepID=W7T9R3_9STRA|nr:hypothetical protein Naga_101567g1 [Nannochloropsis gaditana]